MRVIETPILYIDELHELLGVLKVSYNRKEHFPYIRMAIGSVGYTNEYKGNKDDEHFVARNIKLEIRDDTPDVIVRSLEKILKKCEDY